MVEMLFSFAMCLPVGVSVRNGTVMLYSSKTVKATDFISDLHVLIVLLTDKVTKHASKLLFCENSLC